MGCGKQAERSVLSRIAVEENRVIVDREKTRGGRGAWLHGRETCLSAAVKRRAIPRALRRLDVAVDESALRVGLTGNARKD
ncbi:MAG: YlxR family protein [Anaeromyxobacter sp.]